MNNRTEVSFDTALQAFAPVEARPGVEAIEAAGAAEEAVVAKQALVAEEIGLRKEAVERVETVRDTVRRTEVDIEGDVGARPAGRLPDA